MPGETKQPPQFSASLAAAETHRHSPVKNLRAGICHGRVNEADFEKMVPAQWWKSVFADGLYLKTDGDVVEDPEITKEELRMLEAYPAIAAIFRRGDSLRSGFDEPAKVLDLCCGQGRHSLLLADRYPSLRLYGHDQSSYSISLARERALHSLSPTAHRTALPHFTVGDCRTVPYESKDFDLVMVMGNSFGYFSANDANEGDDGDDGDRAVLHEINRLLKPGGLMVLDLADGGYMRESFSPRSWEWIDDQTFVCRERTMSPDKKRLYSREVVVAATRGVVRDQFYSERLYDRAELASLLGQIGFEVETGHNAAHLADEVLDTVTTARELSQRGQDLGMMEQRLLIIARKVRDVPSVSKRTLAEPEAIESEEQLQRTALNATVRELIEKFRESVVAEDYNDRNLADIMCKDEEGNAMPLLDLPSSGRSSPMPKTLISPTSYHLLPPPPFPDGQLTLIMGDTTLPCREKLNGVWNLEDFDTRRKLVKALLDCGYSPDQIVIMENHRTLVADILTKPPSFVFNLCDEGFMNDALKELHVTSSLEMCQINYSGAGPVSLGVCYDKGLVNATAVKLGIHTPLEFYVLLPEAQDPQAVTEEQLDALVEEKWKTSKMSWPVFVKPMKGDNSLGITGDSICHDKSALLRYILSLVHSFGFKEFIVQEYLTGTEYSVGMIGNPETGFHFLPILQVDYTKVVEQYGLQPILGWESKWDPESPYWTEVDFFVAKRIPRAKKTKASKQDSSATATFEHGQNVSENNRLLLTGGLTEEEEEELKRSCAILFERFGCRDYARFDWRADREIQWNPATGEMKPFRAANTVASSETASAVSPTTSNEENDDGLSATTDISGGSDSGRGSTNAGDDEARHANNEHVAQRSPRLRKLKLLEVNPNPGWCWDGKLAKMAHAAGLEYPDMIKSILWASWERFYGREGMAGVASTLRQSTLQQERSLPQ